MKKLMLIALLGASVSSAWGAAGPALNAEQTAFKNDLNWIIEHSGWLSPKPKISAGSEGLVHYLVEARAAADKGDVQGARKILEQFLAQPNATKLGSFNYAMPQAERAKWGFDQRYPLVPVDLHNMLVQLVDRARGRVDQADFTRKLDLVYKLTGLYESGIEYPQAALNLKRELDEARTEAFKGNIEAAKNLLKDVADSQYLRMRVGSGWTNEQRKQSGLPAEGTPGYRPEYLLHVVFANLLNNRPLFQ